jgi:hypothetical protein
LVLSDHRCYQSSYKVWNADQDMPREQIHVSSLLTPERHPILLARQMLLLASALQYLSPKEAIPGLTKHHHVIVSRLTGGGGAVLKVVPTLTFVLQMEDLVSTNAFHAMSHMDRC